ncbi:MAG TPA: hypothetical protein VGA95_11625 [Thermodesulfobacteriota bacterium]
MPLAYLKGIISIPIGPVSFSSKVEFGFSKNVATTPASGTANKDGSLTKSFSVSAVPDWRDALSMLLLPVNDVVVRTAAVKTRKAI